MGKRRMTRRGFIKGAAAAVAMPYALTSGALGAGARPAASDRVAMGFIGVGTQGGGHLAGGAWTYLPGGYLGRDDVQVLAVCDVWQPRREQAQQRVNGHYASKFGKGNYKACEAYLDFRELLARDDIDAVLIGTPIHWHALMTIMAAKAGKDVYCEKPTSLTIRESRATVDAVRRYGRVFQAGTQQRSEYGGVFRLACELVRSGRIGELKCVYAGISGGGFTPRGGYAGKQPARIDPAWDLWLGPAPWVPGRVPAGAHMFGFGGINWGQHHYDIVQWGLGADHTGPVEISPSQYRYANGVVVYASGWPFGNLGNVGPGGACFVGTKGKVAVGRSGLASDPPDIVRERLGPNDVHLYPCNSHSGNFIECIRTRKPTICDVESTHRAASLLLLGGLAMQLRREEPLKWDPEKEEFVGDDLANRMRSAAKREPWRV